MGADLYIEENHKPACEKYAPLYLAAAQRRDAALPGSPGARKAQAEMDKFHDLMISAGYFRDNYNATSVLWRLGLSWWDDVLPLCDEHRRLKGDALLEFQRMVRAARLRLPTRKELKLEGVTLATRGKYSVVWWHDFFRRKHRELLAFIDEAVARKNSIRCWL